MKRICLALLLLLAFAPRANAQFVFEPTIVISGTSLPAGEVTEPTVKVKLPSKTSIQLVLARETTLNLYWGKLVLSNTAWVSLQGSSVDQKTISVKAHSATFKLRTMYKTATDWAVFKIAKVVGGDHDGQWKIEISFTNYYGTPNGSLPAVYFQAGDVTITPAPVTPVP